MKVFNTTAVCVPSKHYMVDLSGRVKEIRKLVDAGKYFTINRARQYGKTTTLKALQQELQKDYLVLGLSFEGITSSGFRTEGEFVQTFSRLILDQSEFFGVKISEKVIEAFEMYCEQDPAKVRMDELYRTFRRWISREDKRIVLIIDEVDSATNNQVFLDFLGLLRDGYIARESDGTPAFQSVILSGVTDIKHLKNRIRDEDRHKVNSPWNIAADFDIDMSLSESGIRGMLDEYEKDHHSGMDTEAIAKKIREYTNGYPFLVSRICQLIDSEVVNGFGLSKAWTKDGFDEAIKLILTEKNTLFESLTVKLINYPELRDALYSVLMEGTRITYNPMQESILQMEMYGFIVNEGGVIAVSNRIFETLLYNLFLSDADFKDNVFGRNGDLGRSIFIHDCVLDVPLIMDHFIKTYTEVCGPLVDKFREKDGRELFLLYLKPIINGTGNYYIEAQTRDQRRTDVIIDYLGQQYIIELKIWRGDRYNADGERQICEYLDYFGLNTGYMLSFNFNKKKETGVRPVHIGDKLLYEGTV